MAIKKSVAVFNALLSGHEVILDERKYRLFQAGDPVSLPRGETGVVEKGHFFLGVTVQYIAPGKEPAEVYIGADLSLVDFLAACERLPMDYIFAVAAGTALTKINHNTHPKRRKGGYHLS